MPFSWIPRISAALFICLGLTGCSSLKYLLQAGQGQLELINRARPIPEVLKDERTPPHVKKLLTEIDPIKQFGEEKGLKATSNYSEFVQLKRPAAVWVVSACEPLQFKAKEWSFPIVGSFPYLGWFNLDQAKAYADEIKNEGLDVDVRGASAYSTLGWFRDAVLSTMLPETPEALGDLVNVILHESVHATIYIKGQSFFNESLANFIADQLTLTYLDKTRGSPSPEKKAYLLAEQSRKAATEKLHATYIKLADIYSSSASKPEKLEKKELILNQLKAELKLKRPINNATLIQYKTYHSGQDDFRQLFEACRSNWMDFLTLIKSLREEAFSQPQQNDLKPLLEALTQKGCPKITLLKASPNDTTAF